MRRCIISAGVSNAGTCARQGRRAGKGYPPGARLSFRHIALCGVNDRGSAASQSWASDNRTQGDARSGPKH